MKVADLFIGIGLKGAEKVKDGLTGIHGVLSKVKDVSWETKAGILGAIVGLEEMTRRSMNAATALKNFGNSTALSTTELQRWNYWAEMNGISGDEMENTIRGLQQAQAKLALGQDVPQGSVYFGLPQGFHSIDEMLSRIQQKMKQVGNNQAEVAKAVYMMGTLGINPNMAGALRKGTVGFGGMTRDMTLDPADINKLDTLRREWSKFYLTAKGSMDKLVAEHFAGGFIDTVHMMTNAVRELNDLVKSITSTGAWGKISEQFSTAMKGFMFPISILDAMWKKKNGDKTTFLDTAPPALNWAWDKTLGKDMQDWPGLFGKMMGGSPAPAPAAPAAGTTVHIQATNHFEGTEHPREHAKEFVKQVGNAAAQSPALNSFLKGGTQ